MFFLVLLYFCLIKFFVRKVVEVLWFGEKIRNERGVRVWGGGMLRESFKGCFVLRI